MTKRQRTYPQIHLRNAEAGEAAETASAREGEGEGEKGTSSGPAAVTPGQTTSVAAAGGEAAAAAAEAEALAAEVGEVTGQWSRSLVWMLNEGQRIFRRVPFLFFVIKSIFSSRSNVDGIIFWFSQLT